MQEKGVTFDEVYDLYAIRIIFEPKTDSSETERDQCFTIYSKITANYKDRKERMRDWAQTL